MLLLPLIDIFAVKCIELHRIYWNYLRKFCVPLYCNICVCVYFLITKDDWHREQEVHRI